MMMLPHFPLIRRREDAVAGQAPVLSTAVGLLKWGMKRLTG
jgi:hypothetical protein